MSACRPVTGWRRFLISRFVIYRCAMSEPFETVSATEAAALLGLTRERLRQMVVARELPERVADSSRFRPRYVRAEIEAFGRATGRIKTAGDRLSSMRLAVDQLVLPAADRRAFGRRLPAHLRVWEREGWPPLVVIAAPIDGDRLIQVDAEAWQERVRSRVPWRARARCAGWSCGRITSRPLGGMRTRSISRCDAAGTACRFGGLIGASGSPGRGSRMPRSRRSWAARWCASRARSTPSTSSAGCSQRRIGRSSSSGIPGSCASWPRPWSASRTVRLGCPPGDAELALDVACFAASAARLVEERTREAAPESTSVVTIEPARLPADIWRRLDEVAALDRMRASEHQGVPEWAREIRSRRDGIERMLAERGRRAAVAAAGEHQPAASVPARPGPRGGLRGTRGLTVVRRRRCRRGRYRLDRTRCARRGCPSSE